MTAVEKQHVAALRQQMARTAAALDALRHDPELEITPEADAELQRQVAGISALSEPPTTYELLRCAGPDDVVRCATGPRLRLLDGYVCFEAGGGSWPIHRGEGLMDDLASAGVLEVDPLTQPFGRRSQG